MNTMEKDKTFIGVDPGASGALAILRGSETVTVPFSTEAYVELLQGMDASNTFAIVEHVGAMPGQGSVSTFNFGMNFGIIQGVLSALKIPYELVRPQKWKKEFSCTSDKNTSIEVAKRLFPQANFKRTPKCTKDHDGIAEALLLAEYGRRKYV